MHWLGRIVDRDVEGADIEAERLDAHEDVKEAVGVDGKGDGAGRGWLVDVGGDEPADGVEDGGLGGRGPLAAATLEAGLCKTLLVESDERSDSAEILVAVDWLHRAGRQSSSLSSSSSSFAAPLVPLCRVPVGTLDTLLCDVTYV